MAVDTQVGHKISDMVWWLGGYLNCVRRMQISVWQRRTVRFMASRAVESRAQLACDVRSVPPLAGLRAFWAHDPFRSEDLRHLAPFVEKDLKLTPDFIERLIAMRLVRVGPKLLSKG